MNIPFDFDLKLEPNGSFAILTNYKDVFLGTYVDLFRFARKILHNEGFNSTWKVALLTSPKDRSHDVLEIFTHNAGYQVKIFTDYDEAQVWLTWQSHL